MTTTTGPGVPTILGVEDKPDMRDLRRMLLEIDGMHVVEAADGTEALDQFFRLDPPPSPAVVVLDSRMPGMTGLEVAASMLKHNPDKLIVVFSAHLDRNLEAAARELGVAECISKIDARRLPSVVRGLIAR